LGEILVGYGFYEVITDGFYSKTLRDNLGISESHPLWAHVETLNALDKGYTLLKNNGLVQALEGLARNQAMGVEQVRTFEFTRTFHPDPSGCREEAIVWGLLCGSERDPDWAHKPASADIWTAKGIFEEIAQALHAPLTFATEGQSPLAGVLHPHRQQQVFCCDREVGIFGEVHPRLIKSFGIRKGRPIYFELALNRICTLPEAAVPLPGARPYSVRSLAFTLPHGVEGAKVLAVLRVHAHPALVKAEITDVYVHEQDGKPVRTLTFVLSYQNEDASLTAEAINAATEALIPAVHTTLGGLGVRLRA
jgi:phenylalanyl-tRNA synthetase beta chain